MFSLRKCDTFVGHHHSLLLELDVPMDTSLAGSAERASWLLQAKKLDWWLLVLHDLMVMRNLSSEKPYDIGTEVFLAIT